jgi:hypothetical protein
MTVETAQLLVNAFGIYLGCGALFGVLFLWRWVGMLDPLAAHGTFGFRVLVFPGVAALWPVFAVRLASGHRAPPDEWTAHRAASRRQTLPGARA